MLKYVACAVLIIAGYYLLGRSQEEGAPHDLRPRMPNTRVTAERTPEPKNIRQLRTSEVVKAEVKLITEEKAQEFTYPEIQKLIANNDVCALKKLVDGITGEEDRIYIDAFLEATGLSDLKSLIGINGPIYKEPDANNKDPRVQFLDALVVGGVTHSPKRKHHDLEKSLLQITELQTAFPDNAAFSVFKLGLENRLGKSKSQLRETANGLMGAKRYDSLMQEVLKQVLSHRWDSEALHYLSGVIRNHIPLPGASPNLEHGQLLEDEKIAEHLGNLLVQPALNSDKLTISEDYSSYDYYLGNKLLNNKHPNAHELNEIKQPGKYEEIEQDWISYDLEGEDCDRTSFDENFAKLKNRY